MPLHRITRGMDNVLGRLPSKARCKACGMNLPRYPGRYPARCPRCNGDFDFGAVVDRVLKGDCDVDIALMEMESGVSIRGSIDPTSMLYPPGQAPAVKRLTLDPKSTPGRSFQQIITAVNQIGVLDNFIGFEITEDGGFVRLYFSDKIPDESLKELPRRLQSLANDVRVEESDNSEARWMVVMRGVSPPGQEVDTAGTVGQAVQLSGKVEIENGEAEEPIGA